MLEEQKLREAAIELQINKLDSQLKDKDSKLEEVKALKKVEASIVDLDSIKNEFREVDFHPLEARPPEKFTYSANFENIRHTLNTYLKRPIKK